jgi:digeranylgeranylglycerophospholipid reductase
MISVIGAGPAGNFYASKEKSDEVTLFEEHKKVGSPIACTGILTDSVRRVMKVPNKLVLAKIKKFKMVAPSGKSTYINLDKTNMIFNRTEFDNFLLQKALDSGAKLNTDEKFLGYRKLKEGYKIKTSKGFHKTNRIVGADGPFSQVAKSAGLYGDRKFVRGLQARCKYPGLEKGVTMIHMGLGEFSWIVPENEEVARVGVIGTNISKLKKDYKTLLGNAKILQDQSGIIPLYNPKQKLRKKNEDIFLIGDAATQVKATTYGGIIYGLLGGSFLAEDKNSYERKFNSKLGKDLWVSLKMRELMNNMSEKQANELIEIFEKKNNKKVLEKHDRDFPTKFLVQLLMKEAKLWKLGFDLFGKSIFKK